jgi:hypothetical protein
MKLNFFSALLVLLLVTMSVKSVVLLAKIQDQTKYTFVTQANSSLIETAYAKTDSEVIEPKSVDLDIKAKQNDNVRASVLTNTNLPNFDSGFSKDEIQVLQDLSQRRFR